MIATRVKFIEAFIYIGLLALILIFLATGCANVKFNPETGEIDYSRFGSQSIEEFEMTRNVDGSMSVKFGKQEGSAGDLAETALNLSKVAAKIAGVATGVPTP